ncbi:helix-turn-helix domain-containing protein [Pedobacter frigidisoli]|uniref:Helix-turn-helix domain-containing protein n=1 Tax=Pedobacter frigidisoli TaxID=2530455 RepID=A0A4R0P380_9SPHI|nr:helix-turn-helix domain-containing protein [Pedobacter frigidisoli]TCD11019.1 helix-turn-helix domain-containing protein [Pedobacter frigidisoli]
MSKPIIVKNKIQENKMLKVSPFRKGVRATGPHKHNSYFEIIYLSSGSGFHYIDSQGFEIFPNSIFFVRKEQMHYWELSSEPEGYVAIIKKGFIDQSIDKEISTLLLQLSRNSFLQLKNATSVNTIFQLLVAEIDVAGNSSNTVVEGLLKALLGKIQSEGAVMSTGRKQDGNGLCYQFREILSQEKQLKNSVAHYAGKLNTSPQNLNLACKKEMNIPASVVLSEFIINEAKRLLIYTDNTVAEITFELSFNDTSHFVKYFKRFTGYTPQNYRASLV